MMRNYLLMWGPFLLFYLAFTLPCLARTQGSRVERFSEGDLAGHARAY